MNNISEKDWIGLGIAGVVVIGGIVALLFNKKSESNIESKWSHEEEKNTLGVLSEFPKLSREYGGSRKNSKKRNRKSKKRR